MNLLLAVLSIITQPVIATPATDLSAVMRARAVSILNDSHEQIGSGVILDRALVLTNRHVLIDYKGEALFIKTHDGIEFEVPTDQHYLAEVDDFNLASDFGFVRFLDPLHFAPQEPVTLSRIVEQEPLTLAGWVFNEFVSLVSSDFQSKFYPSIYHCVHSVPGLSGAPVFNANGALVAINTGDEIMRNRCKENENPAVEIQIHSIFVATRKLIPQIIPFLDPRFFW